MAVARWVVMRDDRTVNGLVQMRWNVAWFGMRLAHAARRERWLLRWLLHWLLDWLLGLLFGCLLLLATLLFATVALFFPCFFFVLAP